MNVFCGLTDKPMEQVFFILDGEYLHTKKHKSEQNDS